jgi:hypothetical protein
MKDGMKTVVTEKRGRGLEIQQRWISDEGV